MSNRKMDSKYPETPIDGQEGYKGRILSLHDRGLSEQETIDLIARGLGWSRERVIMLFEAILKEKDSESCRAD